MRAGIRVVLSGLLTIGLPCAVAGAAAAPAAAATGCDGVLVVVEFGSLGGGSRTGCAAAPRDGLDALARAGFDVGLGTGRYAGGFVCALDGAPAAGCEAVDLDSHWSYWRMAPGTSRWVYSSTGAAGHRPEPGSIEGWVWQDGGSTAPAARSAVLAAPVTDAPSDKPAPDAPADEAARAEPGPDPRSTGGPAVDGPAVDGPAVDGPPAEPLQFSAAAAPRSGGATGRPSPPVASRSAMAALTAEPPAGQTAAAVAAGGSTPEASSAGAPAWSSWLTALAFGLALLIGGDAIRRSRQAGDADGSPT